MYVPNLLNSVFQPSQENFNRAPLTIDADKTLSVKELKLYSPEELSNWVRLKDFRGKTPLAHAVENNKLELVKFILVHCKADPNEGDNDNWTPLYRASTGESEKQEILKLLISCGADVNLTNKDGSVPLHRLVDRGGLKEVETLLLHQKIDVNVMNSLGTPLAYAAKNGNVEIAKALIGAHANVNLVNDPLALTPLALAKIRRQSDMEAFLISKGALDTAPVGSCLFSPLLQLVQKGEQQEILESFTKQEVDDYGRTVAHYCAAQGKTELLQAMSLEIDRKDNQGRTPLHYAVIQGSAEAAKYLIGIGNALDSQDEQGYAPLMWACQYGRTEIARNLFEKAQQNGTLEKILNIRDNFGWKGLHKAAETNNVEIFRQFIDGFEMDPTELTSPPNCKSPLELAGRTQAKDVISYLEKILKPASGIKG